MVLILEITFYFFLSYEYHHHHHHHHCYVIKYYFLIFVKDNIKIIYIRQLNKIGFFITMDKFDPNLIFVNVNKLKPY
jgi:hypothetical protein